MSNWFMAKNEEDTAQGAARGNRFSLNLTCLFRKHRGWWGNPWGFESPLRHHSNNKREFGFAPGSLFSYFRPEWLISGSRGEGGGSPKSNTVHLTSPPCYPVQNSNRRTGHGTYGGGTSEEGANHRLHQLGGAGQDLSQGEGPIRVVRHGENERSTARLA